jgi:rubredoxin
MICGFCGYEFEEERGIKGCGGCSGGCHSVHCPRCNYKNPLESGVVKKLKTIFGKNIKEKGDKR